MNLKSLQNFATSFFDRFTRDQTTTLASSLAYYTALSLAPLVILFVTISSKLSDSLQATFISQVQALVGPDAAKAFELVIANAKERPDLASASGMVGALTLLLSASLIFGEMRSALNQIFETVPETKKDTSTLQSILLFLKARILQAGLALSFIFILIVSLVASSVISATFSSDQDAWRIINIIVSFASYIGMFTLIFRYLPAKRIAWKPAIKGGAITATLFLVGKEIIGIYLGNSALGSSYGAAGSVIVLLVWVYYSALITFIGAHVSSLLIWKEKHS